MTKVTFIISYFVAIFFSQGSTFFAGILLANTLDVSTYGRFTYLLIFINTFISLTGLGLTSVANRFVSELKDESKEKLSGVLTFFTKSLLFINIPLLLILFIFNNVINDYFFTEPMSYGFWFILILIILLTSFNNLFIGTLQGFLKYKELAITSCIYGISYVLGIYYFSILFGFIGIFIGILTASAIFYIFLLYFVHKKINSFTFNNKIASADKIGIINYIIPNLLISFLTMPTLLITQKYLSSISGGYNEIALFNVAFTLVNLAAIIPSLINTVVSSYLFSQTKNNNLFNSIFRNNQIGLYTIVVLEISLLLVAGRFILNIYGNIYQEAYNILAILSLSLLFDIISNTYSNVIIANNKMWKSLLQIALPRDLATLILGYFLTMKFGATGLAITLLITKILSSIFTFLTYKQITIEQKRNINLIA